MRARMSEKELMEAVIELAQLRGWLVAHFRPARSEQGWRTPVSADGKGFPDLVMIRETRLIAAELKSDTGKVTPEQQVWLDAFGRATTEAYTWRPEHWTSGLIERRLA